MLSTSTRTGATLPRTAACGWPGSPQANVPCALTERVDSCAEAEVLRNADTTSASAMIASSAIRHPEIVMLPTIGMRRVRRARTPELPC